MDEESIKRMEYEEMVKSLYNYYLSHNPMMRLSPCRPESLGDYLGITFVKDLYANN